MHELEVFIKKPDGTEWEKQKLVNATADFSEPDNATTTPGPKKPDGSASEIKKATGPVGYLIDGTDDTSWKADRGVGRRNQASVAVVQFEQPLTYPAGTQIKVAWRMGDMLGCARFSLTTAPSPAAPAFDHAAVLALAVPSAERTPEQSQAVFTAWRNTVPELQTLNGELDALWKSWPVAGTSILHVAQRDSADPRPTHLLDRGNWDQPKDPVEPHVPVAFNPFPAGAPQNRLGFALWLTDPQAPLTARVAVNQVWQSLFGMGLVETAEDFGTRAPVPEYRELLDWLAVDFMEHKSQTPAPHHCFQCHISAVLGRDTGLAGTRSSKPVARPWATLPG
jgi:hypothetical protein